MDYIKRLKEKFWWENILIKCTNENYISIFSKYKKLKENVYIIPLEDLEDIKKEKKTEWRDYCFMTTDRWYWEYQYDYCEYEYEFKGWWWKMAYSIYKKKDWRYKKYSKMIDIFKNKYHYSDNLEMSMEEAFQEVII